MDTTDMATPVTRGEMRAELVQFEARFDQKLEMWGGALLERIKASEQGLIERIKASEHRLIERIKASEQCLIERIKASEQRLIERIDDSERRLLTELARHTRASHEEMSTQVSVIDEKYADLPPRVRRLEAEVFAPRRR